LVLLKAKLAFRSCREKLFTHCLNEVNDELRILMFKHQNNEKRFTEQNGEWKGAVQF
jgi:hypothetical protein